MRKHNSLIRDAAFDKRPLTIMSLIAKCTNSYILVFNSSIQFIFYCLSRFIYKSTGVKSIVTRKCILITILLFEESI